MKKLILFLLLFVSLKCFADEGMWLPQLLGKLNESRMKSLGMKISASDIYSINSGSLKDAIVSFGGFCTGEVISSKGLVLTNHHCGFDAIQNHSSVQHNYINDGFWSKSPGEEIANDGLFVTFIVRINDVTAQVLAGLKPGATAGERQALINKNMDAVNKATQKTATQQSFIRGFFEANEYYQFITETYNDIRLVGAPPASIGNFGHDTDNWVWPRHTGDFSLFRIYANKNNEPAAYSPDNIPYTPRRSLKVSLDGVAEKDFTLIFGFPGRTQEYLPAVAVEQIRTVNDPAKIAIRDKALKVIDGYMRNDESVKIKYASKYAGIQNSYKKWQGEVLGLTRVNAFAKKMNYENEFTKRVEANTGLKAMYGKVLPDLENAYAQMKDYGFARDYFNETISKIELASLSLQLYSLANSNKLDNNAYSLRKQKVRASMFSIINEFDRNVDKAVFVALLENFNKNYPAKFANDNLLQILKANDNDFTKLADQLYSNTVLYDTTALNELFSLSPDDASEKIRNMKAVQYFADMQNNYAGTVQGKVNDIQSNINELQRLYMAGQMAVMTEKKFYPDANSTLRVSYGQVQGYTGRDAVQYDYRTELSGVMQKYVPGDYEFDVPQKLRELYAAKDYGQYGKDGKMYVCFIATNHTTGGNSGSPVLDAYGNLIGLNFDRVWEGTMSDINYDASLCRNIMVDIRYVMFIMDKFAGADRLIKEINFVHPKAKTAK